MTGLTQKPRSMPSPNSKAIWRTYMRSKNYLMRLSSLDLPSTTGTTKTEAIKLRIRHSQLTLLVWAPMLPRGCQGVRASSMITQRSTGKSHNPTKYKRTHMSTAHRTSTPRTNYEPLTPRALIYQNLIILSILSIKIKISSKRAHTPGPPYRKSDTERRTFCRRPQRRGPNKSAQSAGTETSSR